MRRLLFIGNPRAGLRPRPRLLEALRERAKAVGLAAELHETARPGEATAAARHAAFSGDFDAVIAVGGDGTVHEVANGLIGSALPLGLAPAGTMNILARELSIPLDPLRAVDVLPDSRVASFTTGRVAGRHFVLMAGAGFDAYALDVALSRAGAGKITLPGYVTATLRAALRFRYQPFGVVADGESLGGTSAIIGNVPRYGANLLITPRADPLDPFLDLCLFRGRTLWAYQGIFLAILRGGRHVDRRDVIYRKASRIEIRPLDEATGASVPLQFDGEPAGFAPVHIEACPSSLQVLVPKEWRA